MVQCAMNGAIPDESRDPARFRLVAGRDRIYVELRDEERTFMITTAPGRRCRHEIFPMMG
jgi:hypothetical protein